MRRIEFRLSMPSRGSWNGAWSGAEANYIITRDLTDRVAKRVMGDQATNAWYHHWNDGWAAQITARILAPGERKKKSDGFSGYDWMVKNIISHGSTYEKESTSA